jgi:hypothetical protein
MHLVARRPVERGKGLPWRRKLIRNLVLYHLEKLQLDRLDDNRSFHLASFMAAGAHGVQAPAPRRKLRLAGPDVVDGFLQVCSCASHHAA